MDQKQNKQDSDVIRNRTNRTGMDVAQPEEQMVNGMPQKD